VDDTEVGLLLLDTLENAGSLTSEEWDVRMAKLFRDLDLPPEYLKDPERKRWHTNIASTYQPTLLVMPKQGWHECVMKAFATAPHGARIEMPTEESRRLAERASTRFRRDDICFCVKE
jgi:hypothetical protein